MRSPLARTLPPMVLVVVLAACGGADSSDTETAGPSTTWTGVSTASSTGPSTSTADGVRTVTTKSPPGTPGPPRPPVTGSLAPPTTGRAIDPYLPAGVVDQVFPPGTKANDLLSKRKCGALLRQIRGPITEAEKPTTSAWAGAVRADLVNLYLAAGEVCLSNFTVAAAAFRQVSTDNLCPVDPDEPGQLTASNNFDSETECRQTRLGVYSWTERLLKARAANPAFVPNFQPPPER